MTPAQQRTAVTHLRATHLVSTRRACELVHLARSGWYHQSTRAGDDALRDVLRAKAAERPRWGSRRLHFRLASHSWRANCRRVRPVYREAGFPIRRRRRKPVALAGVLRPVVTQPNQVWALDSIGGHCATDRRLRVLSLIGTCTRECLASKVDTSLPDARAYERQVQLAFIRPGEPVENAFEERFHDKIRAARLDQHWFTDLRDSGTSSQRGRTTTTPCVRKAPYSD